jgi:hypothetical protein
VEGHHLHKAARSDEALRLGIEGDVFGEQNPDEKGRTEIPLPSFGNDRGGDPLRTNCIAGVLEKRMPDSKDLFALSRVGWQRIPLGPGRLRRHYGGRKLQQRAGLHELRVLLPQGPDGSGSEENRRADPMKHRFENSLPVRLWFDRSSHRHIREGISGPFLPLVVLEVGHAAFGCTSHATIGMEIALPPMRASHYTDPE